MADSGAHWREAGPHDAESMAAIEHTEGGHGRWDAASFLNELRCAWARSWVLETRQRDVVGFVVVWRVADEVHLLNIAVHDAWRGRGLGRDMLLHLQAWSRDNRLSRILLELREHNLAALRLYKSCGFVINGRRNNYYAQTGEDALLMECLL